MKERMSGVRAVRTGKNDVANTPTPRRAGATQELPGMPQRLSTFSTRRSAPRDRLVKSRRPGSLLQLFLGSDHGHDPGGDPLPPVGVGLFVEKLFLPVPLGDPLQIAIPVQFHPERIVEQVVVEIL